MKNFLFLLPLAGIGFVTLDGAEIPPYYPAPAEVRHTPALKTSEVVVTLPGGMRVEPGKFNQSRSLNGVWKFSGLEKSAKAFSENPRGFEAPGFNDSTWDTIDVPLNWFRKYKGFQDRNESFVQGYYRKTLSLTESEYRDRRVLLHFKFIGYEAVLWINGNRVGDHHGDFIPWTVDITEFVKPGENQLAMQVRTDMGPSLGNVEKAVRTYGAQWGAANIKGGIWGEVELRFEPHIRFAGIYTVPNLTDDTLLVRAELENITGKTVKAQLRVAVSSAHDNKLNSTGVPLAVTLVPGVNRIEQTVKLDRPERWSPESPKLYFATAILTEREKTVSAKSTRFGFREFRIINGKFHLNGKRIYLFGENLPATLGGNPDRSVKDDLESYRTRLAGFKSLGYNIVRNAHMPIMEEALDFADEIGMMVYDEWSWCFTALIDPEEFGKRNEAEFLAWLDRDFNHPSVVMWSCGNEVRHGGKPELRALLDRQVKLIRERDLQKRPASSFSGNACWRAYGTERLETDFLDHHSYVGNGESPWTRWFDNFNGYYEGSLKTYGGKKSLGMPYVIWECVGYSWGGLSDPEFKVNDTAAYAAYVKRPSSWGQPNGVGYIGSLGLAAALDPERGMRYAQRIYGHRLLEMFRQDSRIDGFAPWFHRAELDAATLWNQPVLVGVRNGTGLPPRNFFSEKAMKLELFVANSVAEAFPGGKAEIRVQTAPDRSIPVATVEVSAVKPFEVKAIPFQLSLPREVDGNAQLRIELIREGVSISRNFYPVFVKNAADLATPIEEKKPIALLNVGHAGDVAATGALLKRHGIVFELIDGSSIPAKYAVAVIPAALANQDKLKINREAAFEWMEKGGFLLVLEQRRNSGSLLPGVMPEPAPNTLVDLVHPAHPVFKGLTPSNFDTWENPEHGYSIGVVLRPFLSNALATRGAMIGGSGIDNAIVEAAVGKGRLFWTQLNAVELSERDSVAANYLRNVLVYALSGERYAKVLPLDAARRRDASVDPASLVMIDLRSHANRSFTDEHENDARGGWTDQGSNDFRNMPLGTQTAAGVLFDIIDPAKNHDKSCIVLRGSERQSFPAEAAGIKVGAKLNRLFFLHTAAWSGGEVGAYRIHYTDGGSADFTLRHGANIGDWWLTSLLTEAAPGIMCENTTKPQVGTYVATWENPWPDKEIATLDFLSMSSKLLRGIDYRPGRCAAPILIAVTGEKVGAARTVIDGSVRPASGGHGGKVEIVQAELPGGETGAAWRIDLPAFADEKNPPHAIFRFPAADRKLTDYRFLTLWVKPETAGAIDFDIPERNWKAVLRHTTRLSGSNWTKLRIDLTEMDKAKFLAVGPELRGELFFFNGRNRRVQFPRPPVRFLVTGIALE